MFPICDSTSKRLHDVSFNRRGERLYYTFSFRQNLLNYFWYVIAEKGDTDRCRFCNTGCENVEHILVECEDLDDNLLRVACDKKKIVVNVKNLLTNVKLKYFVEKFLFSNFKKTFFMKK